MSGHLKHSFVLIGAFALTGCSLLISNDPGENPGGPGIDGAVPPADGGPGMDDGGVGVDGHVPPDEDAGTMTGCTDGTRCDGNDLVVCEAGVERRETCPLACGEGRCLAFVPSNVEPSLWDAEAESIDLEEVARFDTTACRAMVVETMIVSQTSGAGRDVCVIQVRDLRIRERATLQIVGSRPVVIMASGDVRIEGALDASAVGDRPGPGGFLGGIRDSIDGGGPVGGHGGEHIELYADGGGGGGALCGAGGSGGVGGAAAGGTGGTPIDAGWELVPLIGGGGGGRGRGTFAVVGGETNAGLGGAGGGAVQISALGRIWVSGVVLAGGGGGGPGTNDVVVGNYGSGGGGGAGGAILVEAPEVDVDGMLLAAGGGGGGGADVRDGSGDPGEDGVLASLMRARGGAPGGSFAGMGGVGGGGDTYAGAEGGEGRGSSGNGGGGGGGVGCVLVRTATGEARVANTNPTGAPGYRVLPVRLE